MLVTIGPLLLALVVAGCSTSRKNGEEPGDPLFDPLLPKLSKTVESRDGRAMTRWCLPDGKCFSKTCGDHEPCTTDGDPQILETFLRLESRQNRENAEKGKALENECVEGKLDSCLRWYGFLTQSKVQADALNQVQTRLCPSEFYVCRVIKEVSSSSDYDLGCYSMDRAHRIECEESKDGQYIRLEIQQKGLFNSVADDLQERHVAIRECYTTRDLKAPPSLRGKCLKKMCTISHNHQRCEQKTVEHDE